MITLSYHDFNGIDCYKLLAYVQLTGQLAVERCLLTMIHSKTRDHDQSCSLNGLTEITTSPLILTECLRGIPNKFKLQPEPRLAAEPFLCSVLHTKL